MLSATQDSCKCGKKTAAGEREKCLHTARLAMLIVSDCKCVIIEIKSDDSCLFILVTTFGQVLFMVARDSNLGVTL